MSATLRPRLFLLAGLSLLAATTSWAQQAFPLPADSLSAERPVAYQIAAELDPDTRSVHGRMRVSWRNPDAVPVGTVQFHLYLNAFRSEQTTFSRESGGLHRGFSADTAAYGSIDLTALRLLTPDSSTDLLGRLRFIQPDDGNPHDRTVAEITLPRAAPAGGIVTFSIDFKARLPRVFARTGWAERPDGALFFMVAQWFPKLGVYEPPGHRYVSPTAPRGRWSTHQFHANSEFYANFGTYDVTLTVPAGYTVGATGVRVAERDGGATRTLTYRAQNVHDFAWTAAERFVVAEDQWRHVRLRVLLQPEHAAQARRHLEAARTALDYFDRWVGLYPYPVLTIVDGIGGSNGMEYPTLITVGTRYGLPARVRLPLEATLIHEFGHQYFYGLLASNEAEEAWLDEGITSYVETRLMDVAYGPGAFIDLLGVRVGAGAALRVWYAKNAPGRGAIYTHSWRYAFPSDYAKASYAKPATLLHTLEHLIGWEAMQRALQLYYDRWRFHHPTSRDFIAAVEEASGRDLGWFFDAYLYGTAIVDYEVAAAATRPAATDSAGRAVRYRSHVVVHRKSDGVFPQTLEARFADGQVERRHWDGHETWRTFRFTHEAPLVEAHLDPENAVWLDVDRLNNRRRVTPERLLARKMQLNLTVWLQQLFSLTSLLF